MDEVAREMEQATKVVELNDAVLIESSDHPTRLLNACPRRSVA